MRKLSAQEVRFLHRRNRSKGNRLGHSDKPRLVVYRSNKHISAQIVDDIKGVTLVSASSIDKSLAKEMEGASSKIEKSRLVGTAMAKKALEKKVKRIVFDRNGHPYHGRVKAVADAAREAGLEF